jgi:hypothetical protein
MIVVELDRAMQRDRRLGLGSGGKRKPEHARRRNSARMESRIESPRVVGTTPLAASRGRRDAALLWSVVDHCCPPPAACQRESHCAVHHQCFTAGVAAVRARTGALISA